MFTSSGSTGGRGGVCGYAKTIIHVSPNTSFGDIIRREAPGVRAKDLIPNFGIIGNCWTRK